MLVIYDFIRSLFDKYGKIQFTSMVVHDIRAYIFQYGKHKSKSPLEKV